MPRAGRKDPNEPNAAILVCDLGRTRLRFATVTHGELGSVSEFPIVAASASPLASLIGRALKAERLDPARTTIFLSVPIYVISEQVNLPPPLSAWSFNAPQLEQDLKVRELKVVNDMTALGFSLPIIVNNREFRLIHANEARRIGYPMITIGVRTGMSALGFVLSGTENPRWEPVQTESGHIGFVAQSKKQQEVVDRIRELQLAAGREEWVVKARDVLSKGGLANLYQAVAKGRATAPAKFKPAALLDMAKGEDELAEVARETMLMWSSCMGSFARTMALAYGAWGGIFIVGELPKLLLAREWPENLKAFDAEFSVPGPDASYMNKVPVTVVTHPDPYLLGLSRFLPSDGQASGGASR